MQQPSKPLLQILAVALLGFGLHGCSASADGDADAAGDLEIVLTVAPHASNSLMAVASITSDSGGLAAIRFSRDGASERMSRWASVDANGTVDIVVVGMRAESEYRLSAVLERADGQTSESAGVVHTTGAVPANAPMVTLSQAASTGSDGGITILSHGSGRRTDTTAPLYFGVDEEGEIVWYLHDTDIRSSDGVARGLGNGNLQVFLTDSVAEITPAGELVASYGFGEHDFHHDAVVLASGNVLLLSTETTLVDNAASAHDGELIAYDVIYEVDPESGQTVWSWSTAEHLDTARFPGALAERSAAQGGLDWSHANALAASPNGDTVLLSSRSQDWVINIDRTTDEILWIFGEESPLGTPSFSEAFFELENGTFQTAQHAPTLAANGDLLLFDNRNESGGGTSASRAVRYSLNETDATARQEWEFVAPKYAPRLGDVDELENGNVLVCAGGGDDETAYLSEVALDGSVVWEVVVHDEVYRAERISWDNFR
tara:strand:+ start:80203 stop:81669 length:1467 start_codon:yes stop_codon:yes gene_type:complete